MDAFCQLDLTRSEIVGGDPFDHGIDVARLTKADLFEHRECRLDDIPAAADALSFFAPLLGEETSPILIEDDQMAGEKLPILIRLEQLLLAEPNDLRRRVKHLLALNRHDP